MDTGRAPESDEEVLARLHPSPNRREPLQAYGAHWTTEHQIARRFATDMNAGGYEKIPGHMRKFNGSGDQWGVVLEGTARGRAADQSIPYSEHEREVRVHTAAEHPAHNVLEALTAHVYDLPSRESIAAKYPLGEPGQVRRRSEEFKRSYREPVRSIPVPPEHWQQPHA